MPFIDQTAQREIIQTAQPYEDFIEPAFGEVFAASVGKTIDEELSISGALNREGWQERRHLVSEKIKAGEINRDNYMDRRGRFDYERLAQDLQDPLIKTDEQLNTERNAVLDMRRSYADDVISRGSGIAQFLGAANAYMLDPINIATLPIATASTAGKSLSVAGRALLTARNEAALAAVAETGIQAFVYEHKHDIGAPMSEGDAIRNIAFAASGGAIVGGAIGGIAGYISKVRKAAEELPQTPELESALDNLARMQNAASDVKSPFDDILDFEHKAKFEGADFEIRSGKGFIQGDIDGDTITLSVSKVDPEFRGKGEGSRLYLAAIDSAKAKGFKTILSDETVSADAIKVYERMIKNGLPVERAPDYKIVKDKGGDFASSDSGSPYKINLDGVESRVDAESKYLSELEDQRGITGAASRTAEMYAEPEPPKAVSSTIGRQDEVLDAVGLKSEYDADIDAFSRLENPVIVDEAGQVVDARAALKEIDDELEGIESVLVCTRG